MVGSTPQCARSPRERQPLEFIYFVAERGAAESGSRRLLVEHQDEWETHPSEAKGKQKREAPGVEPLILSFEDRARVRIL